MNLTFQQFEALAKKHNVIPLFQDISADLETPVSAFVKLRTGQGDFLFESVVGGEKWARYSFLGTGLSQEWRFQSGENGFETLRKEFQHWNTYQDPNLPRFFGGFVGCLGYGMVQEFSGIELKNSKSGEADDLIMMLADRLLIFDNLAQVMKVVSVVILPGGDVSLKKIYDTHQSRIQDWIAILAKPLPALKNQTDHSKIKTQSLLNENQFCDLVRKAKDYIEAGDVFQVVLSTKFVLEPIEEDPFEIYRRLRRMNPSPYMYYLQTQKEQIVGASPEILVRLEDQKIEVRPIAGTKPRGKTEIEDQELESELRDDPKENAEHVMLVDLGRNDVGRVAQKNSVSVDEEKNIERYSHVMHLVSHVSGNLADGNDVFDVIKACFPAGTLSGAPKVRAMQIIEELESQSRGIYGGAIGYISFTGNSDLAISIRTALFKGQKAVVQAGAGIVYNSVPEIEFQECENKAKGMIDAIMKVI